MIEMLTCHLFAVYISGWLVIKSQAMCVDSMVLRS